MSRCYLFPPPGYVLKEINRDKCLIDSIKGTKKDLKKDRKHKKMDKKRKERETDAGRSRDQRHKRQRKDGSGKLVDSDVNFLEKSCQTVELELQSSSQNSCDSTLHSNDERSKQIQSQPLDETSTRIQLPDKVQKDPEDELMMSSKDQNQGFSSEMLAAAPKEYVGQLYSTSQDDSRVSQKKIGDPGFGSSRDITTKLSQEKTSVPSKDNRKVGEKDTMPSSSLRTHPEQEKPSSSHQETIGPSKLSCGKCPPSMAEQFLNLIENWNPDRVESKLTDSEDQEWWMLIKFGAKRQQVTNQKTNQGSCSMAWPTARFLPEAGLHALPFTVPF